MGGGIKALLDLSLAESMTVILDLSIPADRFELGRILEVEDGGHISLETMVPMGERAIPFFRHYDGTDPSFEDDIQDHPAVDDIHIVSTHDGETLYALDWEVAEDTFFAGLKAASAHLLEATGDAEQWTFELRFPSHEAVSEFQTYCVDEEIPIDVQRVFNPTKPAAGPWYGLTAPQREMLSRAVEAGYYSIPRRTSTRDLAAEFSISDQAVTERLRRAIVTLTTNALDLEPQED